MAELFKKLNFKPQTSILVLNHPASFSAELATWNDVTLEYRADQIEQLSYCLIFASQQNQIEQACEQLLPKLIDDALLWFAYPKASSKHYQCDFNRDTGWATLEAANWLPVRMVAIDQDWSALRFRQRSYIKTLTRKQ